MRKHSPIDKVSIGLCLCQKIVYTIGFLFIYFVKEKGFTYEKVFSMDWRLAKIN